jgi:hypothetical protein
MELSDEQLSSYATKIYNAFVESSGNGAIQRAYEAVQDRWGDIENGDEVDVLFFETIKFAIDSYNAILDDEKYDAELLASKKAILLREDLNCPYCGEPHYDIDEWAKKPHRTHLCLFCNSHFEGNVKGVSFPTFVEESQGDISYQNPGDRWQGI